MFSGIVEEVGRIRSSEVRGGNLKLEITCSFIDELKVDQSIALNGVCLTVVEIGTDSYFVDVIAESLSRSNLRNLKAGDAVNLERSLRLNDRLDGHIVQGHVDQTASVVRISQADGSWVYSFVPENKNGLNLLVEKGSITVNGVSLTVSSLNNDSFEVSIIPYTYEHTNFKSLKQGDMVNLEFDILGKYVERILKVRTPVQ